MIKKTLGRYVYEMRLKNNLSLRDLAKETGLSYSYIHTIENGKVNPSREAVVTLSKGLQGSSPNELLCLGGFLPEKQEPKEIHGVIQHDLFSNRLKQCLIQSNWTEETLSVKTNIDRSLLSGWVRPDTYGTSPKHAPDIISIYKLANVLHVTPDFLSGNADEPQETAHSTPRPKNLRDIFALETISLDHIPLDDKRKEKLIEMIYAVFDDK